MKGVILAGGLGSKLSPLTKITNKHLLPIYNKPMIYYPIQTLTRAGIEDIMIIISGPHAGAFIPVLKNGEDFDCNLNFAYQARPDGGIADALRLAENFVGQDDLCVILGDNITDVSIRSEVNDFAQMKEEEGKEEPCCHLFLKSVDNPRIFSIAEMDGSIITDIEEKPTKTRNKMAVIGIYLYDSHVFEFIKGCKPSNRGQLEITDVNNKYVEYGTVTWSEIDGFWTDAGTFDNIFKANEYWKNKEY